MRCLALADALALSGWTCAFACAPETVETMPVLAESGHETFVLGGAAADEVAAMNRRWPQGCDLLIVDHYERDATFESACRGWARRVLAIDDLANRAHDCDVLIDQTLGRREPDYRSLVPAACRLLLGPEYAMLRPQFAAARGQSLARRRAEQPIRRLLVSLGASDPHNVTQIVLDGIAQSGIDADVDVVLGSGAGSLEAVRALADKIPQQTRVHQGVRNMADLMSAADLAIGAAGTSSWERCCLGLPTLIVVAADNQTMIAKELEQAGAAAVLGRAGALTSEDIGRALRDLITDTRTLRAMIASAAQVCDGNGSLRIRLALMTAAYASDGKSVSLRLAAAADTEIMFGWQSDMRTRRFARTPTAPTYEKHKAWVQAVLADPKRILSLILHDDTPAGVLRFDQAEDSDACEVSILIDPAKYGLGIAKAALSLGRALDPRVCLLAEVLPGNEASHRLFRRAGYRPIDTSHYLSEPGLSQ